MNDPIPSTSIRMLPALSTAAAEPAAAKPASGSEFQNLLTALVLSMAMPGAGEQSSAGSGMMGGMAGGMMGGMAGGMMGGLMAPIMAELLEMLVAQQMETGETEEATALTQSAGSPVPSGMPIQGRLTQASHNGHVALDFGAPVGSHVKATMDGKVIHAGWNHQGYGNLVIVENGPYKTYYAHLSEIPVKVGQIVRAGEVIALSGNTGNSTGPHLHYEVRLNGQRMDPAGYIQP